MEIKLVKKTGVPRAEVEAHQQIQREFDNTPFSKAWRGYAAFALARSHKGAGSDDFDLVLVTHTTIVAIELKNWSGKLLQSTGGKWYLDGEEMSTSPVDVISLKAKKLASLMTQKLGPDKTPFINSYVVLHGRIASTKLTAEENKSVLTMAEFLSFRFEQVYKQYFPWRPKFNPTSYLRQYDAFFEGPSFKPKVYFIDGYRPDQSPIFAHPRKLYSEFKATAKDDPTSLALLRQWDFGALGLELLNEGDRATIGLREQRVYEYVAERNEELSLSLLRPLSRKSQKDVTTDFAELFSLPNKASRLTEFIHSVLPQLQWDERVTLMKSVVNRFAELHDLKVAHRDIAEHSIWVDRPAKVVMSGFPAAYYPQMKTVGSFREKVKVEQADVPEKTSDPKKVTPFHRDVFMLGALAHVVLYGERPPKKDGVYLWSERATKTPVDEVLRKALGADPLTRYGNAREFLEALNVATASTSKEVIDFAVFDAFKAVTKERDYPVVESYIDEEDRARYRSDHRGEPVVVRVWYSVEPDPKKPDFALKLLSFLERARTLKGCGLSAVPRVVDFGLSRGSLLLVLQWVAGQTLPAWLKANPTQEARLKVALSIIDGLERLHAVELPHGDIHPGNIVVKVDGAVVFIDVLDFRKNADDVYTTAYLPSNYKALSPYERDRYSAAAVLTEVLGTSRDSPEKGVLPIPRVYEELKHLLAGDTLSTLEPLRKALDDATAPPPQVPEFSVVVPNLAYEGVPKGELRSDNGAFHVSIQKDKRAEGSFRVWITGIGRQLTFSWNASTATASQLRATTIAQSQLLRSQTLRDATIKMHISVADGASADVGDLAHYIFSLEAIKKRLPGLGPAESADEQADTEAGETTGTRTDLDVKDLWQALLEAEENAFRTVTVAGESRKSPHNIGQILVPYHLDNGVIDYDAKDIVLVQMQNQDEVWKDCGRLNLKDTTFGQLAELAIEQVSYRANFRIGTKLRIISTDEKGSFTRRRFAVDRILVDKAVVPGLLRFFDKGATPPPTPTRYPMPSDSDLEIYTEGDKKLNDSQREAFRRVLGNGPISLLQGPPGTGKTWFIASLLHYLMTKERARRILLVSQAHEAVNNALEKALEFCDSKGVRFDAVRLGAESAVSDAIRHLHASSIEETYRERFRAEEKERIVQLAVGLGLPKAFADSVVELYLRLGMIFDRIRALELRKESEHAEARSRLEVRIKALVQTFHQIAKEVYGLAEPHAPEKVLRNIEAQLTEKHEVRSRAAVDQLHGLLRLSQEWISALGSPDANFSEFLAKSRTVVAGTLVGIGYRGAGVVQNAYDWVIIDEAARAAPSELAVAMQAGHRVLLVGDHLQLPPSFSEEVKEAMQERFGADDDSPVFASDFERIFESEYGHAVGSTLLRQYRMAPVIGELVSNCFYESKLETGRGDPPEYFKLLPEPFSKQVTWIDTSALGSRAEEQTSKDDDEKWNTTEARVVMGLLRQILESDDFIEALDKTLRPQEPAVGVICTYAKQREILDQMKAEATWLSGMKRLIKIDTVDSYQGKENRIVILSTVRNNPRMRPGYLRSPKRINVAMSRAMERLFVVGASRMWETRNAQLPLGRVLSEVRRLAANQKASILPASGFTVTS